MNRRGRLEGLPGLLPRQILCRQSSQLFVHQWQQPLGSLEITLLDGSQNARHVGHHTAVEPFASSSSSTDLRCTGAQMPRKQACEQSAAA